MAPEEQIATQFNQISSSIDTGGASISGSSEVTQLLQMLPLGRAVDV